MNMKHIFYSLPVSIQRNFGWHIRRVLYSRLYREHKKQYEQFNSLDTEKKKKWIFTKVKTIAIYAQTNNAFYKSFYSNHGFDANSLKYYEDLQRIPIVTKDILRSSKDKWLPPSTAGFRGNTGGTSGSPLNFAFSRSQLIKENFYIFKLWERIGCSEENTRLVFRGLSHLGDRAWMYHPESDAYLINVYKPFSEIVDGIAELAGAKRIDFLHGYPSAIYQFAKGCSADEHSELRKTIGRNLRGILLGSEYPAPIYRDTITDVFGVPTISWYGHSEKVVLAAEQLELFVYYPFNSYGWCEAVPIGDNINHLVGTSYDNYLTPFIRYDTGDSVDVVKSTDELLHSFRIAKGRIGEYIYDRNNHPVSLTAFIFGRHHSAFDVADFVQISQSKLGKATLHLTCQAQPENLNLTQLFDLKNIDVEFVIQTRPKPYRTSLGKTPLLIPAEELAE